MGCINCKDLSIKITLSSGYSVQATQLLEQLLQISAEMNPQIQELRFPRIKAKSCLYHGRATAYNPKKCCQAAECHRCNDAIDTALRAGLPEAKIPEKNLGKG